MGEVELGQGEVAGLRDLEIGGGAGDDGDRMTGAFDEGCLIGALEAVGGRFGKGSTEQVTTKALRRLREDDVFARDGGGDESAVRGALDLLDGVDGGQADDGCAVLEDGVEGAVDGGRVDERTDGIVDEDEIVRRGGQSGERVGDRLLARISTGDDVDGGM